MSAITACTKLFFVHVPKTGGSTVEAWLQQVLGSRNVRGASNRGLNEQALDAWLNAAEASGTGMRKISNRTAVSYTHLTLPTILLV